MALLPMYYDAVSAEYLEDYKLKIWFADGKSGIVDFTPYTELQSKSNLW